MPVVVAFPLEEALQMIRAAGWSCAEIQHTSVPGPGHGDVAYEASQEVYVVRQRVVGDGQLALTVAGHPGPPRRSEGGVEVHG